jgi:hypothetical protein
MCASGAVADSHALRTSAAVSWGQAGRRRCHRAASRSRIVLVVIHLAHRVVVREEWSPLLRNAGRRVVKTAICRKDMVEKGVGRICRKVGYRGRVKRVWEV